MNNDIIIVVLYYTLHTAYTRIVHRYIIFQSFGMNLNIVSCPPLLQQNNIEQNKQMQLS